MQTGRPLQHLKYRQIISRLDNLKKKCVQGFVFRVELSIYIYMRRMRSDVFHFVFYSFTTSEIEVFKIGCLIVMDFFALNINVHGPVIISQSRMSYL